MKNIEQPYQPSFGEVVKAVDTMTVEQLLATDRRSKSYGLWSEIGFVDSIPSEKDVASLKERLSELEPEKLWELRKTLEPHKLDHARSSEENAKLSEVAPLPTGIVILGKALENELAKRGLVRRFI